MVITSYPDHMGIYTHTHTHTYWGSQLQNFKSLFQMSLLWKGHLYRTPKLIMTQSAAFTKVRSSHWCLDKAQVIVKWWLGISLTLDTITPCPAVYHHNMDAWDHHMLICHFGVMLFQDISGSERLLCYKACLSWERKWYFKTNRNVTPQLINSAAVLDLVTWNYAPQHIHIISLLGLHYTLLY